MLAKCIQNAPESDDLYIFEPYWSDPPLSNNQHQKHTITKTNCTQN